MNGKNCTEQLSPVLLWDIDPEEADMDTCPQQIIVRVLEYGTLEDWRLQAGTFTRPRSPVVHLLHIAHKEGGIQMLSYHTRNENISLKLSNK